MRPHPQQVPPHEYDEVLLALPYSTNVYRHAFDETNLPELDDEGKALAHREFEEDKTALQVRSRTRTTPYPADR